MNLDCWEANFAVTDVAIVIAVGQPRCDFSQVGLPDWLTAHGTERLRPGCPAIHQDEFHMPSPMRSRTRYQVGLGPADRLTRPCADIEAVCRPIDTPVYYDCSLGCAIADRKSSADRSVDPRLPLSSATS